MTSNNNRNPKVGSKSEENDLVRNLSESSRNVCASVVDLFTDEGFCHLDQEDGVSCCFAIDPSKYGLPLERFPRMLVTRHSVQAQPNNKEPNDELFSIAKTFVAGTVAGIKNDAAVYVSITKDPYFRNGIHNPAIGRSLEVLGRDHKRSKHNLDDYDLKTRVDAPEVVADNRFDEEDEYAKMKLENLEASLRKDFNALRSVLRACLHGCDLRDLKSLQRLSPHEVVTPIKNDSILLSNHNISISMLKVECNSRQQTNQEKGSWKRNLMAKEE